MTSISILSRRASEYRCLLTDAGVDVDLAAAEAGGVELANTRVLLADPDLALAHLPLMPRLEWLQSTWAGVRPLVEQPRRDFRLTGVKGIFGPLMSEYVFAQLLSLERRLPQQRQAQARGDWDAELPGLLQGRRLGLLGVGSIGAHLAATGRHFGMEVWGLTREGAPRACLDQSLGSIDLPRLLSECDFLVASLPSTPATENLLDDSALVHIKPGAVLVNVGRGDLLDEAALVRALESGQLRAAVLDVFRQEPLPESHPFWVTPNLIMSFHTAAPSLPQAIAPLFLENLERFRKRQPLAHEVDFRRGY